MTNQALADQIKTQIEDLQTSFDLAKAQGVVVTYHIDKGVKVEICTEINNLELQRIDATENLYKK